MVDTPRTESDLLADTFRDGQAPNSITANDMRDLVVSSKYLNGNGWDFHIDGEYTVGSPRAISGGTRTQVTIDGMAEDIGHPGESHSEEQFWNQVENKLKPPNLNDFGLARFSVTGQSTSASTNRFEVELDVGGGSHPVIFQETGVFAKGAGNAQSFNFMMPLFAGPEFVANGGTIYVTPESDATFWTFALTAVRLYLARP